MGLGLPSCHTFGPFNHVDHHGVGSAIASVSQVVASSTATRLGFDQAVRDTEGGHDPGNNSSRYTVKTAGTLRLPIMSSRQVRPHVGTRG